MILCIEISYQQKKHMDVIILLFPIYHFVLTYTYKCVGLALNYINFSTFVKIDAEQQVRFLL